MGLLSTGAATPKELGATMPAECRLHTPPPAAKPAQAVVPRVVLSETELSSAVHDERRRLHTMKVIIAHLHDPTKFRRASIVQESVIDSSFVEFSTDVLLDPVTLKMMTEFCSSIPHAAERLMFWADVQHLRTLPSAQYTDKMLRKIYEKFLSPHAATPICVPTDMIRGIQDEFDRPGGIQSAGVYLEAQALCLKDLEKDVFPRFEKHKLFDKMKALCEARSETGHATEYDCIYYLLYETYLKPNAKKFVALPPHIHEAFAAKVDADQLDSVAFTDVQYFVLDYVRTELWHDFSVYPPYVARIHESALTPRHWDNYVPNVSAADMTAVLAKLDKMDPADILAKALTLPMDQLANVALAHKIHRDTLLLLLHDKIAHRIFKKFLASRMKDHFVVFVDEVDEFINLPGIEFMQHTAKKLFKKYLSEHAKLQVDMSTKMRQDIQAKLNTPSIDMFKSAIVKVKTGLLQDSLVRYLKSPIHSEMKQEFPDLVRNLMSAVDKGKQLIGSWVVLDETYAIRQLIGEVELAYFKHVVPLTKSVRQGQSGAAS
ncbi:hypothetical protein DYB30_003463 [Aphanomyces astaci]|uniref:RGS domain-containing protein n=1 Tax=Aphanomyces astaci TaxID=112090 RepID=A0A397DTB5_APHAT|nr:hypothetical protein DYB30_003463 [Aphanomyces astaci]